MALQGIFPAMITPFNDSGDKVDEAGLKSMAEFLIQSGAHGLHPCGTTGEAPLLSVAERKVVAETVIRAAKGRVPVIIQTGHMQAHVAAELSAHAAEHGADAISVVTPYYYSLPERALFNYFSTVVSAVPKDFPVYLYNIPQCTSNPVSADLLAHLMTAYSNVVGIKHSQNDIVWLREYLDKSANRAEVFVGSDLVALAGLSAGANGVVSGNANAFPELFVRLFEAVTSGDQDGARALQTHVSHIAQLLGNGGSLASFKEVAARRGVSISRVVREPLATLSTDEVDRVGQALSYAQNHGLISAD